MRQRSMALDPGRSCGISFCRNQNRSSSQSPYFPFLYAWNDFFNPLIYLQSQDNWTISLGLQMFNAIYRNNDAFLLAASVVTLIPIVILFFVAQRYFIQGVVVSGIKG